MSKRSSSAMPGTDSPCTSTSPSSGYSSPTMCLMHTDFPVPDGPRIIEILPSGMAMLRPRRIRLRPKDLWTSTNSTASAAPVGRCLPVCHLNSSSRCSVAMVTVRCAHLSSDRRPRVGAPEKLCPEHPDQVYQHDVQDHRLG